MKQDQVLKCLEAINIPYRIIEHEPVFTIEDILSLHLSKNEEVAKNLFLRDANGRNHFLVIAHKDTIVQLKDLRDILGVSNLSFASPQRLEKYLCLEKGAVTPFGLINDSFHQVQVIIDKTLEGKETLGFHPNVNTATVWISYGNLIRFIKDQGNKYLVVDFKGHVNQE